MFAWLDDALQDSSEIVTASRRLARETRLAHSTAMLANGATAWRTPRVSALHDWLTQLVANSSEPGALPVVLNTQQSRILWERCLRREIANPLLNMRMLSSQSRETWNKICEWCVPIVEVEQHARNRDQALFVKAAKSYSSILERENWIDDAMLADLARDEIRAGRCRAPKKLTVAGFDRITPQLQALLDTIRSCGGSVAQFNTPNQQADIVLTRAENRDIELRAAGAWARAQVEQSPDLRLAIVVTHLEQDAQRALRLIKEGMIPGWQTADATHNKVVDISYGRRLAEYPAVAIALLALRWLHDDLQTLDISRLLLSSLFSSDKTDEAIRLELHLRQQPAQSWSPHRLLAEVASSGDQAENSEPVNRLSRLAEHREQLPRRQSPADWATMFHTILRDLAWPGVESLDSDEFQLVNRWRELLNEFARLDLVSTSMTAAEALGRMSSIASETIYQPEATGTVIQVMGPLEAAGLQFDRLYVTGMSSANWPAQARPMPLVSRDLQRDFAMPDSTPADTLQFAQKVVGRLLNSAPCVRLSYAFADGDTQHSPSELLADWQAKDAGEVADPGWYAGQLCGQLAGASPCKDYVPGVASNETIAGGAATIQLQFEEPFSAFVAGRLGVRPLWPITNGLSPSIRGSLIHTALHRLYEDCPSGEDIRNWSEAELERRISRAVTRAFGPPERNADAVLRRLLLLERERVARLLRDVVEVDAQREEFRIESVEQDFTVRIAGLELRLRIDRVDVDASGDRFVLDYKTGAPKQLLDRKNSPKNMQLVVYACALPTPVGGFGLLYIDTRAVKLDGTGRLLTPDINWDSALAGWTSQVELAAQEILTGDVRVNAMQTVQDARQFGLLSRFTELTCE